MAKQSEQVDIFIATHSGKTRDRLEEIRAIISKELPNAEEKISYKIPSYYENGYIVYFAGYEKFISLYPVHNTVAAFGDELKPYISGKATARFPNDQPLPIPLIKKIVKLLAKQNKERALARKNK